MPHKNTSQISKTQHASPNNLRRDARDAYLRARAFSRLAEFLAATIDAGVGDISQMGLILGAGKLRQFRAVGMTQCEHEEATVRLRNWTKRGALFRRWAREREFDELVKRHFPDDAK